jgi:hypothetical protein
MVVVALLCSAGQAAAQQKAEANRLLIEREAKGILFLAHPTVKLTSATYKMLTPYQDGSYALTFKFTWQNALDQPCYRYWHFYFDPEGTIYQIGDGDTDTFFPPFELNNEILKGVKDNIREQMRTGKLKENDPVAKLILAAPDMRTLTVLLLRLSQN